MWLTVNKLLHRTRYGVGVAAFIFWIYVNLFMWLAVPYADFGYRWVGDIELHVWGIEAGTPAAAQLQENDAVLAINGIRPSPRGPVYPLPRAETYWLTVQRGDEVFMTEVHYPSLPGSTALDYRLPAGILSGLIWIIGSLVFYFAHGHQTAAIHVGYSLILTALAIIGVQGLILGVPGAWIGIDLLFVVAASFVYIGFLPRTDPLPRSVRLVLWVICGLAALLTLLAVFEGVWLFPQTSWHRLIGVSSYRVGMGVTFLSAISLCVILVVRYRRTPVSYERRQLLILITFMSMGAFPASLFAFLPRLVFGFTVIPLPVAISLLILCPLGYFYVIFRYDYLNLDLLFSRIASLVLTTCVILGLYGILFFTVQRQLHLQAGLLAHFVVVAPVLILSGYLGQPVTNTVNRVFFGAQLVGSLEQLPAIASRLAAKPEAATLQAIISGVSQDFNIPQALLAMKNSQGLVSVLACVNTPDVRDGSPICPKNVLIRTRTDEHVLFQQYPWAELFVPVRLKGKPLGYLALAQPKGDRFNAQHLVFFSRLADLLAIGVEAVLLFETTYQRSLEVLRAQERERRRLASLIHDSPLQKLTFVMAGLEQIEERLAGSMPELMQSLAEGVEDVRDAAYDLRQICIGLYPPALNQGLSYIAEDLASYFRRTHGLNVALDVQLPVGYDGNQEVLNTTYYILRESLNNVVKHAQTQSARVLLSLEQGVLRIVVTDEGIGGEYVLMSLNDLFLREHFGINEMVTWANLAGGNLVVEGNWPTGTRIVCRLPVEG